MVGDHVGIRFFPFWGDVLSAALAGVPGFPPSAPALGHPRPFPARRPVLTTPNGAPSIQWRSPALSHVPPPTFAPPPVPGPGCPRPHPSMVLASPLPANLPPL